MTATLVGVVVVLLALLVLRLIGRVLGLVLRLALLALLAGLLLLAFSTRHPDPAPDDPGRGYSPRTRAIDAPPRLRRTSGSPVLTDRPAQPPSAGPPGRSSRPDVRPQALSML